MNHRAVLGWGLAGAFAAVVSCSGGSNNGSGNPAGFGVDCGSDKDCKSYSLLCGADDTCVECLGDSDCKRTESCSAGLCKPIQECDSSRDCSLDQVCDGATGVCVDCVTNRDCLNGQACVQNACVREQTCEVSSDCDKGVCDTKAGVCVECRDERDCDSGQACTENACVDVTGSGGADGTGSAGADTGGTEAGGADTGGTSNAGTSNAGTSNAGTSNAGTSSGGSGSGCNCDGTDVCTPDARCVAPTVLDDLYDCDNKILAIEGRSGTWAADADFDINLTHGYGDPGSNWADHSCAAWAIGGVGVGAVDTSFAFIGFVLHSGSVYSLSGYNGLLVTLESDASVQVVLKTIGGGYFDYVLTPKSGSNVRQAPFAAMNYMAISTEATLDLSKVYEIQFSPSDASAGFGLAVHRVELY